MENGMNVLYVMWVCLLLASCFFISLVIVKKGTLMKTFTVSLSVFLIEYYVISVVFLWIDIFEVIYILLCMSLVNAILALTKWKKIVDETCRMGERIQKKDLVIVAMILLVLPFTMTKSEDIRTSSDMGMYFEKAVVLMGEDTRVVKKLEEIGTISADVDEGVLAIQEQLQGIYIRGSEGEDIIYDYHSIPTWVTFLALFGKMFGLMNCTWALTILYVWAILCSFYCCENISKDKYGKYMAFVVFALSPVIIYVSKATLTEIAFVAVLFSGCMFLSEEDIKCKYISIFSFALLAYIHISMYLYMPIFIACLMYIYINKRERIYAIINVAWTALYMISIFYCHRISYRYMRDQYMRFSFLGSNLKQVVFWLLIIFLMMIILQVLLMCMSEERKICLAQWLQKLVPAVIILFEIVIIVGSAVIGYRLGFTNTYEPVGGTWHLRTTYVGKGWEAIRHLNIVNILMCTGIVSVPVLFGYSAFRKEKQDIIENCLYLISLYAILIYTFIQVDTPNNYYASRYFAMIIIPVIALLMGRITLKRQMVIALMIGIIGFNSFFDFFFIGRGSFQGQYTLMNDVLKEIPEDAIVLVREEDKSLNQLLVNNLRELNGNKVYNYKNYEEIREAYKPEALYLISSVEQNGESQKLVLKKEYEIMGNLGGVDGRYMTEDINTYNEMICIYEMNY